MGRTKQSGDENMGEKDWKAFIRWLDINIPALALKAFKAGPLGLLNPLTKLFTNGTKTPSEKLHNSLKCKPNAAKKNFRMLIFCQYRVIFLQPTWDIFPLPTDISSL
ncbi:hypothetical protein KJS94_12885 [Flavihumibacter rivuli]|uniref:hypothetical protein n=1 Tax=Flavihumibacter rivuli TaxID=2838156 RepID=UPI001BDE5F18|nr:hypothetical protein [Flavihumibacter rivuli]ULQ55540.1 hypothetical protein KJS94_12885 [Flavihumibacter rivuli]